MFKQKLWIRLIYLKRRIHGAFQQGLGVFSNFLCSFDVFSTIYCSNDGIDRVLGILYIALQFFRMPVASSKISSLHLAPISAYQEMLIFQKTRQRTTRGTK